MIKCVHWKFTVFIKALPGDIRIQAADGDVWANKAFLSVSSDYFNAMLDEKKFKEGQEGVGDLKMYSKEVVSRVINYFYTGEISCQVKDVKKCFKSGNFSLKLKCSTFPV